MQCFGVDDIEKAKRDLEEYGVCCIRGAIDESDVNKSGVDFAQLPHDTRESSRTGGCTNNAHLKDIIDRTLPLSEFLTGTAQRLAFPIEARRYEHPSRGMDMHVDTELYSPAQLEAVYTVRNTDTCTRFEWKDGRNRIHSLQPSRGDLVYVLAGRTEHQVTSLCDGTRDILKFATASHTATRTDNYQTELEECAPVN